MPTIRLATSAEDRLRVLTVTHAANASRDPLAYYQALRLKLPRRHAGAWWLREDQGVALGRERLTGWFDPVPGLGAHFDDRGRATTRPMVRGVDGVERARFRGTDYL